jgi:hypothetical protein
VGCFGGGPISGLFGLRVVAWRSFVRVGNTGCLCLWLVRGLLCRSGAGGLVRPCLCWFVVLVVFRVGFVLSGLLDGCAGRLDLMPRMGRFDHRLG